MEVQEADALVQAARREDSQNVEEIAKLSTEVERLTTQMANEADAHTSRVAALEAEKDKFEAKATQLEASVSNARLSHRTRQPIHT